MPWRSTRPTSPRRCGPRWPRAATSCGRRAGTTCLPTTPPPSPPARPSRCARSGGSPGAVPPSGVTGAAFYRGRLFLAGQDAGALQLWSIDITGATAPRLELELPGVAAESEGLDVLDARGGVLHWLLSPFAPGRPSAHLRDRPQRAPDLRRRHRRPPARPRGADPRGGRAAATRITVTVTDRYSGRVHRVSGRPRGRRLGARAHGLDGTARDVAPAAASRHVRAAAGVAGRPRALRVTRDAQARRLLSRAPPRSSVRARELRRASAAAHASAAREQSTPRRPTGAGRRSVQPVTHHREPPRTRGGANRMDRWPCKGTVDGP